MRAKRQVGIGGVVLSEGDVKRPSTAAARTMLGCLLLAALGCGCIASPIADLPKSEGDAEQVTTLASLASDLARPDFLAPWPCGLTWSASTYAGHVTGALDSNAIDFNNLSDGSDDGEKALASASGTAVLKSGSGYGNYVDIDHGGGWITRYAHLRNTPTLVDRDPSAAGSQVWAGDVIGNVGGTGGVAPHLHYEQMLNGRRAPIVFNWLVIVPGTTYTPRDPKVTSSNCTYRRHLGARAFGNVDGVGGEDLVLWRPSERRFFVDLGVDGTVQRDFTWGSIGDEPYLANVDGKGGDDLVLRRGNTLFVNFGVNGASQDRRFGLGQAADVPR